MVNTDLSPEQRGGQEAAFSALATKVLTDLHNDRVTDLLRTDPEAVSTDPIAWRGVVRIAVTVLDTGYTRMGSSFPGLAQIENDITAQLEDPNVSVDDKERFGTATIGQLTIAARGIYSADINYPTTEIAKELAPEFVPVTDLNTRIKFGKVEGTVKQVLENPEWRRRAFNSTTSAISGKATEIVEGQPVFSYNELRLIQDVVSSHLRSGKRQLGEKYAIKVLTLGSKLRAELAKVNNDPYALPEDLREEARETGNWIMSVLEMEGALTTIRQERQAQPSINPEKTIDVYTSSTMEPGQTSSVTNEPSSKNRVKRQTLQDRIVERRSRREVAKRMRQTYNLNDGNGMRAQIYGKLKPA